MSNRLQDAIVRRPWLLPVVIVLASSDRPLRPSEIASDLGVRTSLVKRALWHLRKADAVMIVEDGEVLKYKLKESVREHAEALLRNTKGDKANMVLRIGETYYLIRVRRRKVVVRSVPAKVLERVRSLLASSPDGRFAVGDVSEVLGEPPRLMTIALKTLMVLGEVVRDEQGLYSINRSPSKTPAHSQEAA